MDINVIYMNISGVLDNFAWCILYEKDPSLINQIHPNEVGLFSKNFRKRLPLFSSIDAEIRKHDLWFEELKEKRNPVAHRIPLYVPSSIVTSNEAKRYEKSLHDAIQLI